MADMTEYNVLYDACEILGLEVSIHMASERLLLEVTRDGEGVWCKIVSDDETLEDVAAQAIRYLRERGVHVSDF